MNASHGLKIVLLIAVTGLLLIAVKWAFARGRRLPATAPATCASGSGSGCTPARDTPPSPSCGGDGDG